MYGFVKKYASCLKAIVDTLAQKEINTLIFLYKYGME